MTAARALNSYEPAGPSWLPPLLAHLGETGVGIVGPTTNRTCNEAQIDANYRTVAQLTRFAAARRRDFEGRSTNMKMLAMFCVAARSTTFAEIGPLDEGFELGPRLELLDERRFSNGVVHLRYRLL